MLRREFLEGMATLPLSYFFLPHTNAGFGFAAEESTDEMISRGGPFSVALLPVDQVNTNERVYPAAVVQKAIDKLPNGTLLASLKDVAFNVSHLRIARNNDYCTGKWLWGDVRVLDTPQGRRMKQLLRNEGLDSYAFRTGGMGNGKNIDGKLVICPGFSFLCIAMIPVKEATTAKS